MAAVLDRLVDGNDQIAAEVDSELQSGLALVDFTDPASARSALFEFVPPLVAKWGDIAAAAAAEWFEEFRSVEGVSGPFRAELAAAIPLEQVNARLGFVTRDSGNLFKGKSGDVQDFLSLMVNEYALQPGRDTVADNSRRDGAAYARVPEHGACKFCLMLASRGFVYSRSSAGSRADGKRFHGHCRCHPMPVYDETRARVEYGYDPRAILKAYQAAT
jgi:hypothetical protein